MVEDKGSRRNGGEDKRMSTQSFFDETTDQSQVKAEIVEKYVSVYRQSRPPGSRGRDRSREGGEQMRGLGADLRRRWVVD
jgi:hypothetical protein